MSRRFLPVIILQPPEMPFQVESEGDKHNPSVECQYQEPRPATRAGMST